MMLAIINSSYIVGFMSLFPGIDQSREADRSADKEMIKSDWRAIGNDLWKAFSDYTEQNNMKINVSK
jgi:hypothetical protein